MKIFNNLFLIIIATIIVGTACKKKITDEPDPSFTAIKNHSSEIKFSFKENGILKDWKMNAEFQTSGDTLYLYTQSEPINGSFSISIVNFKGIGTYSFTQSLVGNHSSYFSYTCDGHGYQIKDTAAIVKIIMYDTVNKLIQGTFEAKGLDLNHNIPPYYMSLTEGEFFFGSETLHNVLVSK